MRELKGQVSGNRGVASASLALDLAGINDVIKSNLGIALPLVTGTFNVKLSDVKPLAIEQCRFERPGEVLTFQKCRVRKSDTCNCVQGVILTTSMHVASTDFENTLEIMAPYHLRSLFSLKDGDAVIVEIEGDDTWWRLPDSLA